MIVTMAWGHARILERTQDAVSDNGESKKRHLRGVKYEHLCPVPFTAFLLSDLPETGHVARRGVRIPRKAMAAVGQVEIFLLLATG